MKEVGGDGGVAFAGEIVGYLADEHIHTGGVVNHYHARKGAITVGCAQVGGHFRIAHG